MTNFKSLKIIVFFTLLAIAFLQCSQPNQDELEHKIINLGFKACSPQEPLNWGTIISLELAEKWPSADSEKVINFLNDLYQILEQQPPTYPYHIYIDESFVGGVASYGYKEPSLYLQFKYGASKEELQKFWQANRNIYQYKKLEKKFFGDQADIEEKNFNGMPLIVDKIVYTICLCEYYNWLKQQIGKPLPDFSPLIHLNQTFQSQNKKAILWLTCLKFKKEPIILSAIDSRGKRTIYIEFKPGIPLQQLISPAIINKTKKLFVAPLKAKKH